jgi:hypothetical protein
MTDTPRNQTAQGLRLLQGVCLQVPGRSVPADRRLRMPLRVQCLELMQNDDSAGGRGYAIPSYNELIHDSIRSRPVRSKQANFVQLGYVVMGSFV